MQDVAVIENPAAAEASLDPVRARLLAELARARVCDDACGPGPPAAPEGQLPPPHARAARARGVGGGAPEGQRHRARDAGDCRGVRDLAVGPGLGAARSLPLTGPAVGVLAAGPGGPARARRGRVAARRSPGAAPSRDVRARRAGPLPLGSRPGGFAEELSTTVARLVARYHDEEAVGGRDHRLIVAIHPTVPTPTDDPAGRPELERKES